MINEADVIVLLSSDSEDSAVSDYKSLNYQSIQENANEDRRYQK